MALGLLLIVGVANARRSGRNEYSDFSRFSLSLGGGLGFTESHQGILDLKTELQFGVTSRIRLGLGIGYMNGEGRMGFGKDRNDGREEMTADQTDRDGYRQGYRQDFRVIPLSLNVYYALPLGRRWSIFASGGGSLYFGSFRDAGERKDKDAWGGQGGLGVEFRLNQRLMLIAEGNYRFAEFHGVNSSRPEGQASLTDGSATNCNAATVSLHNSRLDLNGFSLRAGVKFGF